MRDLASPRIETKVPSKHTPWEWRAVFPKSGRPYVLAGIRSPLSDVIDPAERAANARLMAAAPDLLKTLAEIAKQELSADMSVDDQLGGDFEGAYNHMVELAREAIAKAGA